jgi:hypothetical protein
MCLKIGILLRVHSDYLGGFHFGTGPGFDFRRLQIFLEAAGLERGPLSLVRTTEDLPEGKVAAPVYKTEINDGRNPLL